MRFILVPCEALCSQVVQMVVSHGAGKEALEEYLLP